MVGPPDTDGAKRLHFDAAPADKGMRLDQFLTQKAAQVEGLALTRSRVQSLIEEGAVLVNGAHRPAKTRLHGDEKVALAIAAPQAIDVQPEAIPLDVVFEDAHLLVVNKPAGLLVHPGAGQKQGTLVSALLHHCRDLSGIGGKMRPGIVHRIDRGTSGLLVVAKNDQAHQHLAEQFAQRKVQKVYRAWVYGVPKSAHGTLDTPFGRHPLRRTLYTGKHPAAAQRRAVTHYEVIESAGGVSEMRIKIDTGRTHQIRVHMSEMGHPIVGDPNYGPKNAKRLSNSPLRPLVSALDHQALHAAELCFAHPKSLEEMAFKAPLPEDIQVLAKAMAALR